MGTAEADDDSDEVMTETGSTEAFEGALAAPIVFTLSNKNIVAVWTSAHEQADADAYQGFNGHFTILSQTGEEISEPQMIVEDGSIMDRTDSNAITSGVASFTRSLLPLSLPRLRSFFKILQRREQKGKIETTFFKQQQKR